MSDQWLTYPALAELWKISPEAARTRARRGQYQRRVSNDGQAEVLVDSSAPIRKPRPPRAGGQSQTTAIMTTPDAETPPTAIVTALEGHIATLRDQLARVEALAADRGREAALAHERLATINVELLRITVDLMAARQTAEARPRGWWARLVG